MSICVTMDEIWLHHFAPEPNRQSDKWLYVINRFLRVHRLLYGVSEAFKRMMKNQPHLKKKLQICENDIQLQELRFKSLPHPPSLQIWIQRLFCFPYLKRDVAGMQFCCAEEVLTETW